MSTFGSFSTVRLGIYSAQKGLDVTGNNITNINTTGYTRQRLSQVSLVTSASDRYYSVYKARIGQGAVINGIDQLRDPGLDISYRKANSDMGATDAKLSGLESLASILDEVGKGDGEQDDGVLLNQLNDLRDLINQTLSTGMNDTQDGLIRSSAEALVTLFNTAADKLAEMKETYTTNLNNQVDTVNNLLNAIRDLNVSIRNADIRGDAALELRDQRNLLLDELSQYVKFDAKYSMENIGAGVEVERLTITLATGNKNTLIDGEYGTQFSQTLLATNPNYPDTNPNPYLDGNGNPTNDPEQAAKLDNDNFSLALTPLSDSKGNEAPGAAHQNLGDTDLYGALQSTREILTEKGEYSTQNDIAADNGALSKRGIPYYQQALDNLAYEFAEVFNQLNQIDPDTVGNVYEAVNDVTLGKDVFVDQDGNQILGYAADGSSNTPLTSDLFDMTTLTQAVLTAHQTDPNFTQEDAEKEAKEIISKNMELLRTSGVLKDAYSNYTGGPLISNSSNGNDSAGITAANISVSQGWKQGNISMQATLLPNASSGDTSNLAKFLDAFNQKHDFMPSDVAMDATGAAYTGSFEDMLLHIQSVLAEDQMTTSAVYNNYAVTLDEVYVSRDSVTGVDLNDEATSLMTYQKAYSAACRLMTTLNDALDSLLAMG